MSGTLAAPSSIRAFFNYHSEIIVCRKTQVGPCLNRRRCIVAIHRWGSQDVVNAFPSCDRSFGSNMMGNEINCDEETRCDTISACRNPFTTRINHTVAGRGRWAQKPKELDRCLVDDPRCLPVKKLEPRHGLRHASVLLFLGSIALLVGSMGVSRSFVAVASAASQHSRGARPGDTERGRQIFNGKGICFYCHGRDGYLDQLPQLAADTAAVIANLSPRPADLRNPRGLRLTNDRERFHIIRDGHLGTGMLPDTSLTDEEITDTLAYLLVLRHEGHPNR